MSQSNGGSTMDAQKIFKPKRKNWLWYWMCRLGDALVLWVVAKGFGLMVALFVSFKSRNRMSHDNGIGGKGTITIVKDQKFPKHEFFEPGKEFDVRVRHASATFLDDAMNCIRSLSIKFADTDYKSPLDLSMNTGARSLFWSASSFMQFAKDRRQKYGIEYREYYRKYPNGLKGSIEACRRHAQGFEHLYYYAKTPFLYMGDDGIKRYAKYRVVPFDMAPEPGQETDPSEWDQCNQRILPHETRGRNYFKSKYEDQVKKGSVKYRLQIQTRPATEDESPEVLNNMVVWDENLFPWFDLGHIEITSTLDWAESTRLGFSVAHMPKTLGILPARNIYDYNSLNYMRAQSWLAYKLRILAYRLFGMVPEIPDNDNRNVSDWGQ